MIFSILERPLWNVALVLLLSPFPPLLNPAFLLFDFLCCSSAPNPTRRRKESAVATRDQAKEKPQRQAEAEFGSEVSRLDVEEVSKAGKVRLGAETQEGLGYRWVSKENLSMCSAVLPCSLLWHF